jgi:hypothetical protein
MVRVLSSSRRAEDLHVDLEVLKISGVLRSCTEMHDDGRKYLD